MKTVYAIDLDDVLIDKELKVIEKNKAKLLELYDNSNNLIIIYTARADVKEQYDFVKNILKLNNIPYHAIVLGKLKYDKLIDDKAVSKFEDIGNGN